ncbi:dihydroneopterin aldolase [Ectothiorhodospira haloalkaliphila]|uniref:7,8-dihydroneopterin aldolase n=1 Tax=Ectothiorhodospira haloalkaliphila TaxID=421628 RepID=W8KMR7_9GAMM|nr:MULTISPECIES: dihydroneopterin aldolase [Ectothiorhodospira]AHK78297.1 dihydroneopterin aldolase [Ectothiorhodospira haloalkaliphila]MCG5493355.1 dihydroneopterin aldolase [Ectothiorhodospira variabilis]MCG5496701.1 dihydroneopterin aldolase [Ectothiorhodospira variabilis]MCG5502684.1 dihydroneopterin aldolase [Ectothiorhodospira variabilis]MCG5505550.1 dihydroneopterin aldolase [Ectothiorhodospira variabilis]
MDIVYIRDLKVKTTVGIFDWERSIRQEVRIDLEMGTDIRPASDSDCIDHTLDYKAVAKRVIALVESNERELVEAMAEDIARMVMQEFSVPWLRLTLGKPGAVRGAREVGVSIERGERG